MIVYVDSSVVLRVVLGEPGLLRGWSRIRRAVASQLIRIECLRTIDRARIRMRLPEADVAERRAAALEVLAGFDMVPLDGAVLRRAADPFSTTLGSLDALHLATALQVCETIADLQLATHDRELATAARAVGFRVLGATVADGVRTRSSSPRTRSRCRRGPGIRSRRPSRRRHGRSRRRAPAPGAASSSR
jgi:predicted nucleic acid-binding protein